MRRDAGQCRVRSGRVRIGLCTGLLALLAGLFAGCGGADGEPEVAVPPDCFESWNREAASLKFGQHAYSEHESRQGQMTVLEPSPGAVNIKGNEACAMVFAVPETDDEYGDVGLVVTRFGWASMQEIARGDTPRLNAIQRAASEAPNIAVFPDGSIEEL